MDPHYFEDDFGKFQASHPIPKTLGIFALDLTLFTEAIKAVRNLRNVEPLKSIIVKEALPGPECQTDDELKTYLKKYLSTVWRACTIFSLFISAES